MDMMSARRKKKTKMRSPSRVSLKIDEDEQGLHCIVIACMVFFVFHYGFTFNQLMIHTLEPGCVYVWRHSSDPSTKGGGF